MNLTLAMLTLTALSANAAVTQEFIYTQAPFPSAHASTIVELKNGDLLSAWFGGSAEGKPDVAIWTSRRTHGAWTTPAELAREPNIACYNPVLFYSADGKLWLYYKFGPHPSSWSAARRFSTDAAKPGRHRTSPRWHLRPHSRQTADTLQRRHREWNLRRELSFLGSLDRTQH